MMVTGSTALAIENMALRARIKQLEAALRPFADMGRAMMGRRHHNEAVVQYSLAPSIMVHHLTAAYAALEGK